MTVSLKKYSHEEIQKMSMIELATLLMLEEKKAIHFKDIFEQAADLKGFTKQQKRDLIAQFYTDLNVDGRFLTTGDNMWGLKRWYPVEQMDEVVHVTPKRKKKVRQKSEEEIEEELDIVDDEIEIFDEDFVEEDFEEDEDYDEAFDEDYDEDYDEKIEEDEELVDEDYLDDKEKK
ncbi:DNA-directed RNA polymerase subunit delta [Virgibacillus proomii]|jgi:DNA-directed RNA polymerase subunit delta|uniref:DNA-directed RNA polymerase subunit delta n=1 Tax=Virgibacillus proomii TaxID=84407 RepID=UPI00318468C0